MSLFADYNALLNKVTDLTARLDNLHRNYTSMAARFAHSPVHTYNATGRHDPLVLDTTYHATAKQYAIQSADAAKKLEVLGRVQELYLNHPGGSNQVAGGGRWQPVAAGGGRWQGTEISATVDLLPDGRARLKLHVGSTVHEVRAHLVAAE